MKRYLESPIKKDLPQKIILLTGPRQCGKTYLSKHLYDSFDYFNYDSEKDRKSLKEVSWDRQKPLLIFDELHKMKLWKRWLKGVYDTEGIPPEILVTGSSRLDIAKRMGDSLAGRFFQFRLHPIDMKEAIKYYNKDEQKVFDQLWHCSGFPEPFLKDNLTYYKRWRSSHLDIILRQDLIDLYAVRDIQSIKMLVSLLKERIGSTISYASLARDLERDPNTVKRWLQLLENLYVIFRVTPFHKKISRSILKEPKFYFYDHTYAEENGQRLENLVACALFKELQFIEDTTGDRTALHYLRTKDGKEVDFLISINNQARLMLEVKYSDTTYPAAFDHFGHFFPEMTKILLVKNLDRERTYRQGVEVRSVVKWLSKFSFHSL